MRALFYPGRAEPAKAAVHAVAGTLAVLCAAYNAIAFMLRREPHLLQNAIFYGGCACFERYQTQRHLGARKGGS